MHIDSSTGVGSNNAKSHSNLTSGLKKAINGKKLAILIDGANLYHSFVNKHKVRIDYMQILAWFSAHAQVEVISYYTAYKPEDEQQNSFMLGLEKIGYLVVKKPVKVYGDFTKGNLDIEIAVDAILLQEKYDTLVLFSGDGDFRYLAEKLEDGGKQVISISSGGFTSSELHEQVDHYFFLDRIREIWQTPKKPTKIPKVEVVTKTKQSPTKAAKKQQVSQVKSESAEQAILAIDAPTIISDNIDDYQENYSQKTRINLKIPVKICTKN